MQELPVHSGKKQDHFSALLRRRDLWLAEAAKNPQQAVKPLQALTIECVTETLLLTGVSVSKEEVSLVAGSGDPNSEHSDTILGQFHALRAIKDAAGADPSLTQSLMCEVNRLSSPPGGGHFRKGPGRAQFAGGTPAPASLVGGRVLNLIEWLAASSGQSLHLPAKAALAFTRLLEISPFESGNFRTAHLLLNFFAFAEKFPPLFLSAKDSDVLRLDVERGLGFDTLPLATRLAGAQTASLAFCLEALTPS
jgi:hypothetical protein